MPAAPTTWIRFAPLTVREARIRSGISGCRAVSCRTANAASSASDSAPSPSVRPASQPSSAAGFTIVKTPSIIAPVIRTAPGKSAPSASPMP